MKASKKLQIQFADFKAEFVHLCQSFGGKRNERAEHTGGENSAFLIPCLWGNLRASIGEPLLIKHWVNSGIYLQFTDNTGECPFSIHGEFNQYSHKWNISTFGGDYVECCNEALSEFARRLERATGRKECDPAVFSSQILEAA